MKRFTLLYLATVVVLTIIATLLFRIVWPEQYSDWLFTIPLFFIVMLMVMSWIESAAHLKGKEPSLYNMGYRIAKIVLAVGLLIAYFAIVGKNLLAYAVTFVVFYVALSTIETIHFIKEAKRVE